MALKIQPQSDSFDYGVLVPTTRTSVKNLNKVCQSERLPGLLREVAGMQVDDYDPVGRVAFGQGQAYCTGTVLDDEGYRLLLGRIARDHLGSEAARPRAGWPGNPRTDSRGGRPRRLSPESGRMQLRLSELDAAARRHAGLYRGQGGGARSDHRAWPVHQPAAAAAACLPRRRCSWQPRTARRAPGRISS